MSDFEPFYDVSRSYEDNYEQGPFGAFAEALKDGNGADAAGTTSEGALAPFWASRSICLSAFPQAAAQQPFHHGRFPHGFRSGDLQNRAFARLGLQPVPERARRTPQSADGSLTPGSAELDEGVLADTNYEQPIPSPTASVCLAEP